MKHCEDKVGNWYQIAGTRRYTLDEGRKKGTGAIDVRTGSGFEYTVLPDRGLDISLATYRGSNLVFLGPQGETAPAYYDMHGRNWLYSFYAGLLTTCGPDNLGGPCVDDGEELGQHGRFNNTPATNVACDLDMLSDDPEIKITGTIDFSESLMSKLKVKRTITSPVGKSEVTVHDLIRNEGGKAVPLSLLYHINFGYPLLDETVQIEVSSDKVESCNDYAEEYLEERGAFGVPDVSNEEKNYLHSFDPGRTAFARILNRKLGIGVEISFQTDAFEYLNQWKMEGIKDYVLALEPCTVPCLNRAELRQRNMLKYINPKEELELVFTIKILDLEE